MRSKDQARAENYVKEHQKRKWWQRGVSALAAVAVFCTTYAMILPAITWERSLVCELPEHHHEDACYETVTVPAERQLICGQEEHEHTPECYEQVLVCTEEEHEGHTHNEGCYERTLLCTEEEREGHTHGDGCYERVLVCTEEEHEGHTHGEGCFNDAGELTCGLEETEGHTHTDACWQEELVCQLEEIEGHTHTDACWQEDLVCRLEEAEGHVHTEECYESRLICSAEEHMHTDDCYETVGEEHEEQVLVCGLEEHEHTAACFDAPPAEDDGYYCGEIEHTHSEEQYCYFSDGTLQCTLPEHVHTLACKSDPKADVENEAEWVSSFAGVALSGSWADDVMAIAETQLGYTESTLNYEVQEDGTTMHGYTRYGDWYGNTYGDWCAMFCSFCLHYAQVDRGGFPLEQNTGMWVSTLTEKGLYHSINSGYEPERGDLVFINLDEDPGADHVGFVYEIQEDGLTTVEGNCCECVCMAERKFAVGEIIGYGELPNNPDYRAFGAIESAPASDGAVAVISGDLPEDAEAVIKAIPRTGSELTELLGEEKAATVMAYIAYDITILVNGEEWQPDDTVSVVIRNPNIAISEETSVAVAHVDSETDMVSDIPAEVSAAGDIAFAADGFSEFIICRLSSGGNTVILACSDVQEPTNSYSFSTGDYTRQKQIITNIVSQVKTVYPTISGFFCGGDYNFDITRGDSAKTQKGAELVSGTIKDLFPGMTDEKMVLLQGNHDDFCTGLTPTGGYDKGAYAVYVINEPSYPSGTSATQGACQQLADGLRSWLSALAQDNYGKPVFILSHVPLHYSGRTIMDGDAVYAQLLYDAIEANGNSLNIIFLYGHDHAHGDDDYLGGASQFLTRGDKITVAQSGSRTGSLEKTLNFTYMNYGFVGYYWDNWGETSGPVNTATDSALTMTTFEINGSSVTIRRWDENGQHMLKAAGAASLGYRGINDPVQPDTRTYSSPQTVSAPEGSGEEQAETYTYTDDETKVTVKTNGNYSVTVEPLETVSALEEAGITEYLMFDVTVEGFSGKAEVTMPTRPGYNIVWHVKDGKLEQISDAVFNGDGTVTFTTTSFSPLGTAPNMDDTNWFHVEYYDGVPYNVCNPIDFPSGKTGYAISHIDVFAEFEVPVPVNGRVYNFNPNLVPADTQYVTLSGQYGDGTPATYHLESRGISSDPVRGDQIRLGDSDDVTSARNYLEVGTEDNPVYWTVTFEKTFTVYVDDNRLETEYFDGAEEREIPFCFSATTTYWDEEHNMCPGFEYPEPFDYSGIDLDLGSGFGTITVQKNVSGLRLDEDKTFVFHVYHYDESGRLFEDCDVTVKGGKTNGQNTLVYVPYGTYYVEEDMDSAVISGFTVETTYDCESVEISEEHPSGLLIATNTYTSEQPDIPEGIWGGDIDFLKSEVETAATGIEGSATGTENVHTICLEVVPPEKKDVAIVMLMDTTSSMRNQCAACGVPKQYHPDQPDPEAGTECPVTNWEGSTDYVQACGHFVERKAISEATAKAFINSLGNLPSQNGTVYLRIVPFGAETVPDYTGWIDVTANGGATNAQTAITNLPQKSGTNVSAAMRSAYEILSGDLPDGIAPENTYVLLLTDGAPSVSDLANLPSDALSQSYIQSWLNKWSSYSHYEYVDDINDEVDVGYYIGAPYYAEKINGLSSHLFTVMLGNNLDWGCGYDNFENWRYVGGIGINAHDHLKSYSDYSLYATSQTQLTAYYNSILYALAPTLETISVTDPMSEHVDFLEFTDSNGSTKTISQNVAVYDANTGTITWNPKAVTPDADGHYRLYYNVRIKTEANGFVDGQLYPANDTATATYTLKYPDGHTETGTKEVPDPEIKGQLGKLSFTKVSANGTPLSGAKFKLVHDADCVWCHDNDWPYRDGKTFEDIHFESDANGNVSVNKIPSGHTYKLYETQAPDGYLPFTGSLNVTVAYGTATVSGASDIWDNMHHYLTDQSTAVRLTITKDVVGVAEERSFPFEVTLKDGSGQTVKLTAGTYTPGGSAAYTVASDGKITFSLTDGQSVVIEGIPAGSKATIKETAHQGYSVKITDGNGYVQIADTDTLTLANDKALTVENIPEMNGALLPSTGGVGVRHLLTLGALLITGSVMYGFMLRRKRERRAE